MIALRKFLFYWFLLIYVVLCPLIIFYALGYIFSSDVGRGVVKTGMIHLQSLPSKAVVSLNGKTLADVTPLTFGDLMPGDYELAVSFPGYKTWRKNVRIEAGKATVLDQILLVPPKLSSAALSAAAYDSLRVVPDTSFLVLSSGDKVKDANIFDWSDGSQRLLQPGEGGFGDDKIVTMTVVPESDRILLETDHDGARRYLWFSIGARSGEVLDLTNLLANQKKPRLFWDPDDDDYLFCYSDHFLSLLNLREMAVFPNFAEGIYGYGVLDGRLFGLKNSSVVTMDISGKPRPFTVMEEAEFIGNLFDPAGEYRIYGVSDELTVLLGQKGELLTNRLPYLFADGGVRGFAFHRKPEKLLIWTKNSIGIVEMSKPRSRRKFFEPGLKTEWIYLDGKSIEEAFWVNDGAYVLFRDQDKLLLMDVGSGYDNPPDPILTVRADQSVFYTEETGKVYYLEPSNRRLMEAQILPDERFLARKIAHAIETQAAGFEKTAAAKAELK